MDNGAEVEFLDALLHRLRVVPAGAVVIHSPEHMQCDIDISVDEAPDRFHQVDDSLLRFNAADTNQAVGLPGIRVLASYRREPCGIDTVGLDDDAIRIS